LEIRSLHHVQVAIPAGGEAEARRFFGELLGLREVLKPPNLARRGGVWFEVGDRQVHIGVDPKFRPTSKAHIALEVDDLAGLRTHLDRHGVETMDDEPLAGYRRFYARDPFGNRIEFLEPTV
jgi:catechol 2,3-dioxygenase-like lactoylglutathione lyase family enzyme